MYLKPGVIPSAQLLVGNCELVLGVLVVACYSGGDCSGGASVSDGGTEAVLDKAETPVTAGVTPLLQNKTRVKATCRH
jgi:hypothetical protein